MSRSFRRGGQTYEGCIVTSGSNQFEDWSTAVRFQVVVLVSLLGKSCRPAVYHHICYSFSKPVVAGWIVVVVCLWVCGRCRFWGWWSYCGGYIYFTLHDGRVLLPCASALCLSMLRWFLSKGTARRRDCASMRDWALCLACFERRCSSARSVKTGAVCRQAKIKRFRVSRGKSRCRDGVPRAHVTRCLVLRAELCERKIIELQMSRCGAALARIKVSASRGERKI